MSELNLTVPVLDDVAVLIIPGFQRRGELGVSSRMCPRFFFGDCSCMEEEKCGGAGRVVLLPPSLLVHI